MKRFIVILFALFLPSLASAHDFWIEPSNFRPAAGENVTAALRVGQNVQGEALPRIPPLIDRFVMKGSGAELPVVGRPGADPAGITRVVDGGLHWIGYQSNAYPMTLDAQKFEDYLRQEGLERIIERRAKTGQSAMPGRERFYRCAKALLATPGGSGVYDTPLGFTLELVPRKSPYAIRAGGELPVELLFRGKPIANVLVVATNKEDPAQVVRARTDARGRASLRLGRSGFWLVKAVHMESAPVDAPAKDKADWESWWASITFDLAK